MHGGIIIYHYYTTSCMQSSLCSEIINHAKFKKRDKTNVFILYYMKDNTDKVRTE